MSGRTASPARPAPFALGPWTCVTIFLAGLALRAVNYASVRLLIDDSPMHVPTAFHYTLGAYLGPDSWYTPPLKHLLLWPFLALGHDPVAWRLPGVLFGAACVLLAFLVARRAFKTPLPAIAAALIVALDPLSITLSHATQEEAPTTFFMLLGLLFFLKFLESDEDRDLFAVGLSLGVAGALRQYLIAVIAVTVVVALARGVRDRRQWTRVVAYLVALPLTVYAAAYLPWATRGHDLADLTASQADAVNLMGQPAFLAKLSAFGDPRRWLFGFVAVGLKSAADGARGVITMWMTDPPVWWSFTPAVVYTLLRGRKDRDVAAITMAACFVALYALFLVTPRDIFIYSAYPLVPLGAIAIGRALEALPRRLAIGLLVLVCVVGLYLFPLVSGIQVPLSLYGWTGAYL